MDLSHHLSKEARLRIPNPMKDIIRLMRSRKNAISLANGNPHHSSFPISRVDFHVPKLAGDNIVGDWKSRKLEQQLFTVDSFDSEHVVLDLKTAMQYGVGAGTLELIALLKELNVKIHGPLPHNHVLLHLGNGDGVSRCFRLLGDPGDTFMAEEFSFAGLTHVPLAHGVRWAPIKVDSGGLVPEDMDRVLSEWDEERLGKRPRVLYLIPCGQNPTGSTLNSERRREIYRLAQKWDVIIIEDDPYYFLQFHGESTDRKLRESFASMDVDGRVIRLDSFSKLVAPGLRLGWFTCNEFFMHHLETLADSSCQQPHGFGQIFISELLSPAPRGWGFDGYIKWCTSVADEYQRKRDLMLQHLETGFAESWGRLAIADTPMAGMFVCLQIAVEKHRSFRRLDDPADGPKTNTKEVMEALFHYLLNLGVMVIPAATFAIEDTLGVQVDHIHDRVAFLRLAFVDDDNLIAQGAQLVASGVRSFFQTPEGQV